MKRGFFAHCICYREQIYHKHILFLNEKDEIIEITPFSNETSNTTFIDGILICRISLIPYSFNRLHATIKKQIENPKTRLSLAILKNPVYKNNMPNMGGRCLLCNIPEICWENERPESLSIEINEIFRP